MDKVKIGVIGTGFARSTQLPAFENIPDAEVVSVASGSLTNAERTAGEFGIGHFTDDWKETVERGDVELVCITTPPVLHQEMTLFALEQNKHILCEKPMAMNAAGAAEMTAKAKEKNVLALIDHELRFLSGRQKAFEMIRAGEIGKVIHCRQIFRNSSRLDADYKWNWWSDKDSGGGVLGAIGSHAVDGVRWLLGAEVSEVFCLLKTNVKERADEAGEKRKVSSDDEANLILKFAGSDFTKDATGTIAMSMVEAGGYDFECGIYGTGGALFLSESGELFRAGKKDSKPQKIDLASNPAPPGTKPSGWTRGFMSFAGEIVAAIKAGRTEIPHAAAFEDGLKVQKVLDAAVESHAEGKMIETA
jgi:predicted dehydrogenase